MKTLLILRHAKSSWSNPDLPDHDRPLNKRGLHDAPCVGKLLRKQGLVPDLILRSTAKRAEQTAAIVAEQSGYLGAIQSVGQLYLASPTAYLQALSEVDEPHQRVLVVGHNPGLEDLLIVTTGESHSLPTAALAQVSLEINAWSELDRHTKGNLVNLWRPKEL